MSSSWRPANASEVDCSACTPAAAVLSTLAPPGSGIPTSPYSASSPSSASRPTSSTRPGRPSTKQVGWSGECLTILWTRPAGRFSRGGQSLVEAMAAQLPYGALGLAQPVGSIDATGPEITVRCHDGLFRARHVVMAVTPALAVSSIQFRPALPDKLQVLAADLPVWMGSTIKFVAQYSQPFWRAAGLAGSAFSHSGPLREIHDMSGPAGSPAALFGFAPSPHVTAADLTGPAIEQLTTLFGPDAATPEEVQVHDWSADRFRSPPDVHTRALSGASVIPSSAARPCAAACTGPRPKSRA